MMKRHFIRTAATLVAAVLLSLQCFAVPQTSASSAILIDADTGAVLLEQNPSERSLIASTTKIMTAIVVIEHCDLSQTVTVPVEAAGIEGSSMYLKAGEKLTIRDLLYGMMLHSGNDAAVVLALACSGSVEAFAAQMNETAQSLSLKDTHFANPNGLDSKENYSTAADLAAMTRYALKNPAFAEIVSTKSIRVGKRCLTNHNKLLWSVEGAIGVKTGYTRAAGRILVSAAQREGRKLIAVTINDGNDWHDHSVMYDYGFSCYTYRTAIKAGQAVALLPLADGTQVPLIAAETFSYALSEQDRLKVRPLYPRIALCAGEAGTPAGIGGVYLGETFLGTIRLIWGEGEGENEGTDPEDSVGTRDHIPS